MSEQLLDNHKSLDNLDESVKTLQGNLSSTRASLSKELATVKGQIAVLHKNPPSSASDQPHIQPSALPVPLLRSSSTNTQHHPSLRDSERHTNLILSGVEETSLSDTKVLADEILEFVAGRPVSIGDLVRLGHPKRQQNADPSACYPRPVLIKLTSTWDCRLVLAFSLLLAFFLIKRMSKE